MNSPPITRFPEHISINIHETFSYSLQVFDPDGDFFQCSSSISIVDPCLLTIPANTFNANHPEDEILIKIEIIEYTNSAKDQIRSRLPYQIIAYLNDENRTGECLKTPSITLLNVENDLIYILFNESIQIDLISQSQCDIEMDECSMISSFHWKIKSIIETTIEDQIQMQFEWTPRLVEQCGYHIHCIRCFDQFDNSNEKCLQIFVNGFDCRKFLQFRKKFFR